MSERRPRAVIFAGPTISAEEIAAAWEIPDADLEVLPPARQGDVLRLVEELPDVIAIVDGTFFHTPTLLHREILLAVEHGAHVVGGASLGALRAAELDEFGMEGIGEVYRLYRRGAIDGDDEVAVLHGAAEDGFRPLTEALVNLRYNVRRAQRCRVISPGTARAVVARARALHFSERVYDVMLDPAGLERRMYAELEALRRFLRDEAVDLKRQDAIALVRAVSDRCAGQSRWPARSSIPAVQTAHFWWHRREYLGRQVGTDHISDDLVVSIQRLISPSLPRLSRRVLLRCLAVDEAAHRGLADADQSTLLAHLRAARALSSDDAYRAWLREPCLTEPDLVAELRETDLEVRLVDLYRTLHPALAGRAALYRQIVHDVAVRTGAGDAVLTRPPYMWPGVPWSEPLTRHLKLRGRFRSALEAAAQILSYRDGTFGHDDLLTGSPRWRSAIRSHFAQQWGVDEAEMDAAIAERGFHHPALFLEAASHVYAYEQRRQQSILWSDIELP